MGRLTYLMNVSLDGFVADAEGGLDWSDPDDELHSWFNEQTRGVEVALYGRRLYELMSAYWPTAETAPDARPVTIEYARIWNAMPKVVFSHSLDRVDHNSRLVRGDVGEIYRELRRERDGEMEVGGPELAAQFVRLGLVGHYQLAIHPVVLGSGKPFWPTLEAPLRLRLVDRLEFASGVEVRSYVPA